MATGFYDRVHAPGLQYAVSAAFRLHDRDSGHGRRGKLANECISYRGNEMKDSWRHTFSHYRRTIVERETSMEGDGKCIIIILFFET